MKKNEVQPTEQPPDYSQAAAPRATVIAGLPIGPESARMTCPHCYREIFTHAKKEISGLAWLLGVIIFFAGGACGCCLIPCCLESCKNTKHYCPECRAFLGKYKH